MKALILGAVMAAAACLSVPVSAETHYKSHISVGAKAGMSMSRIAFSPSVPQTWLNGMMMGVSVRYQEEKIFGLIAELNYVQAGWKETFEDNPGLEYSRRLTYVELPILTHITFGSSRFRGFFNAGPQFGYMLGESINSNFDYHNPEAAGIDTYIRHTPQMDMEINGKFDYGIAAGLGLEFWVQPRHSVVLEARFYYGLGNIFPSGKTDFFGSSNAMNLQITAGYNFRLK